MSVHEDGEHDGDRQRPPAPDTTATFKPLREETPAAEPAADRGQDLTGDQVRSIEALPEAAALLLVQSGANVGARFLLDATTTTAGRHPGSDIFLDDVTVSRRHARFVRTGEGFAVHDAGSLNGTYVNRERVDSHDLAPGDEVQIGKYRLTYHPHRPAL